MERNNDNDVLQLIFMRLIFNVFACHVGDGRGRGIVNKMNKNRSDCEPSCLFVILHQQWQGHTIPSFTGETPGNEHIVNINITRRT